MSAGEYDRATQYFKKAFETVKNTFGEYDIKTA